MTTCPRCKQPIIRTFWCNEPVDLAPGPRVFATLEPFADDPADGVRVFCATNSYVEHRAVCPAVLQPGVSLPETVPSAKEPAKSRKSGAVMPSVQSVSTKGRMPLAPAGAPTKGAKP